MPSAKALLLTTWIPLLALSGCTGDAPEATTILVDFPDSDADIEASITLEQIRQEAGGEPPSAYHQLQAWSKATEISIEVREFTFGHCLDRINSLPEVAGCSAESNAYWALAVNGQVSSVGMDEVQLREGDTVSWTLTASTFE